jgi:hypothetical protein
MSSLILKCARTGVVNRRMSTATAVAKPNTKCDACLHYEATIADFKPGPKICANPTIAGDAALWRRGLHRTGL